MKIFLSLLTAFLLYVYLGGFWAVMFVVLAMVVAKSRWEK